jgi:hypothetical protein
VNPAPIVPVYANTCVRTRALKTGSGWLTTWLDWRTATLHSFVVLRMPSFECSIGFAK